MPSNARKEPPWSEQMKKRTLAILDALDRMYGTDVECHLDYHAPWQLLVATILSAQCTDARVNLVTPELFRKYPTVEALAKADIQELEEAVKTTGFFRNKAKNIKACAQKLMQEYKGEVPRSIEELTGLPGVGRKTANVIRGNIYKDPSVVVDTHVKRISNRLGLTKNQDPVKIEFDLMKEIPKDRWIRYNIQVISFGRAICRAQNPKCQECFLQQYCTVGASRKNQKSSAKKGR